MLPSYPVTLWVEKQPIPSPYPASLETWGDHIRKKRLDLGLKQKDFAKLMGVNKKTVDGRELRGATPQADKMKRIIDFLGYVPYDPKQPLSKRITTWRLSNGLTQAMFARLVALNQLVC